MILYYLLRYVEVVPKLLTFLMEQEASHFREACLLPFSTKDAAIMR